MNAIRKFALATSIMALLFAGCENMALHGSGPAMTLQSTRNTILVNESATVLIKSENTLGTHPRVEWSTTMGKVTPIKDGMLDFRADKPTAIFTCDRAGEATVTAILTMDDGKILSDSVKINVNAMR